MKTWVMIAGIIFGIILGCTMLRAGVKSWVVLLLLGTLFMGLGVYFKYLGQNSIELSRVIE